MVILGPENHYAAGIVCSFALRPSSSFLIRSRYLLSIILSRIFMLKCNIAMLRLTPLLTLLSLPLFLSHLRAFHHRVRAPRRLLTTSLEDVVLAAFPIAWFFGFLYYTDIPGLASVLATIVAATKRQNALAGLVCSCLQLAKY